MSTILSIAFHEFGHAIAAASEGVEIEYVAIFVAVLFPGAFVALNYDLLQNRPLFSMLRIYCAGIWHNVMVSHAIVHWLFPKHMSKTSFLVMSLFISIRYCHLLPLNICGTSC